MKTKRKLKVTKKRTKRIIIFVRTNNIKYQSELKKLQILHNKRLKKLQTKKGFIRKRLTKKEKRYLGKINVRFDISRIRLDRKFPKIKRKIVPIQLRKKIKKRTRKQVTINYRIHEQPYYISIRAITINPDINDKGLLLSIIPYKNKLEMQYNIKGKGYIGYETKVIPQSEDKKLNDMKVHIEIFIKNRASYITI